MLQYLIAIIFYFGIVGSAKAYADAGPPLLTDDPNVLGNNNWEINLAFVAELSRQIKALDAPLADINYGLGNRLQLKLELPWVRKWKDGNEIKSGFNSGITGVRWLFFDDKESHIFISTYPQQTFRVPAPERFRSADAGDSPNFLLPFEFQLDLGSWSLNEEIGTLFSKGQNNQWIYGSAISHQITDSFIILAEIHGQIIDFKNTFLFNIGNAIDLNHRYSLLFSAGHTLKINQGDPPAYIGYLALQIHL